MFFDQTILDVIARGVILSCLALAWVIIVVRLVGLRAFSKMTSFDFVTTVATGSLLAGASQASDWAGFFQGVLAIAMLLGAQVAVARARKASDGFEDLAQNTPVLIMSDGRFIEPALRRTRVAEADVMAKLREANVGDLADVRAVVLETTGDISVLHGQGLHETLLDGVRTVR